MANIFRDVFVPRPKRSKYRFRPEHITTSDFGKLIPIFCTDVVPSDRFKIGAECFIQFDPLLAPIMTSCECRLDYFFVPNRILWKNWENFITGGEDGTLQPIKPYFDLAKVTGANLNGIGSLFDYFGVAPAYDTQDFTLSPDEIRSDTRNGHFTPNQQLVDALPFLAYQKIFSDWYRDQNIDDIPEFKIDNIPDGELDMQDDQTGLYAARLRYRRWRKDLFTSALPWAQRGPEATLPLGGEAPVNISAKSPLAFVRTLGSSGLYPVDQSVGLSEIVSKNLRTSGGRPGPDAEGVAITADGIAVDHEHSVKTATIANQLKATADLSEASAITIEELRRLSSVQRWLERNGRAGGRYIEQILSHFGVRVPDFRLDRSEYIGGSTSAMSVSSVLQQAGPETGTPTAQKSGDAMISGFARTRTYNVQEHGWIIALLSVIPKAYYSQGIPRMFTRFDKFDYGFPEFQNLGEQEIRNKEIFAYGANVDGVFGYAPRYHEYKWMPPRISGMMRNVYRFWQLGREFGTLPTLSPEFLEVTPTGEQKQRIFAVEDPVSYAFPFDHFKVRCRFTIHAKRPFARNAVPRLVG